MGGRGAGSFATMKNFRIECRSPPSCNLPQETWASVLEEHFGSGPPAFLRYEVLAVQLGRIEAWMELRDDLLMAAGDFVHAVVAFADSLTGWGPSPPSPRPGGLHHPGAEDQPGRPRPRTGHPHLRRHYAPRWPQHPGLGRHRQPQRRPPDRPLRCTQYLLKAER